MRKLPVIIVIVFVIGTASLYPALYSLKSPVTNQSDRLSLRPTSTSGHEQYCKRLLAELRKEKDVETGRTSKRESCRKTIVCNNRIMSLLKQQKGKLLPMEVVEGVKHFVLFAGHARSGSSITGSLLDAHEHTVLANEYYILKQLAKNPEFHSSKRNVFSALFQRAKVMSKQTAPGGKGYSLYIKNSTMGAYRDRIDVIGDKAASTLTGFFLTNPDRFAEIFNQLRKIVGIQFKIVQVIRNPFDNMATGFIYNSGGRDLRKDLLSTNSSRLLPMKNLIPRTNYYFSHHCAVEEMASKFGLDVHQVHLSDLIARPQEEVMKMCSFLQLQCDREYLRTCEKAMFQEASHTRHKVEWTNQQIDTVHQLIQKFDYLQRYSFDSV